MHRLLPLGAALAATAVGLAVAAPQADAAHPRPTPTHFAFKAAGTGSAVLGGDVPASSSRTAFSVVACTNLAGLHHHNTTAAVDLPNGLGHLHNVTTRTWTTQAGARTSSWSTNAVESLTIAQSSLGTLSIDGIRSVAHAYHDKSGFHATATSDVASIKAVGPGGLALPGSPYKIPSPGQSVTVPGLATISMGAKTQRTTARSASAQTDGLSIKIIGTDTIVRVASARARLNSGMVSGLFRGHADGINATALDGAAKVGREPNLLMPCIGTGGEVRKRSTASVPLSSSVGDVLDLGAVNSQERATQNARRAHGYTQGGVASADLGGGQVKLEGIVGRVNVNWNKAAHRYAVNSRGTTVGSIEIGGQAASLPDLDGYEIPGVAKFETDVFTKNRRGGTVTAVRVTLLDGSGAVINLGNATFHISGIR